MGQPFSQLSLMKALNERSTSRRKRLESMKTGNGTKNQAKTL
jgi:hypothetical protein